MGKIIETKIDRWDGGISNDPRDSRENYFRIVTNFDTITVPNKLIPYRQSESGDSNASTSRKQNFAVALRTGTTYSLYGLGVISGNNRPEVEYMDLDASLNSDTWTAPSANQGGANDNITNVRFNSWVYYQNLGFIFGIVNNTSSNDLRIFAFSPTGTAWNSDVLSATLAGSSNSSVCAQGLVHSKNDHLFMAHDFRITRKSQGSSATDQWTQSAFLVPAHYYITSLCEWGNFLAIGCANRNGVGNSRIFLWNMDTSNTLPSESIDAGSGSLMILEEVDGELVAISQKGGASSSFSGIPNQNSSHRDRVIFRRLVGNRMVKFHELLADRAGGINTTSLPIYKQKFDNRLFFQMIIQLNGAVRDGVWSIGRSSEGAPFSLVHERTSNNNTALTTGDAVRGFIQIGDFLFQSFGSGGAGATYNTNKTVESSTTSYTATSIVETKIFDGREHGFDGSWYKDLVEVSVGTEEMTSTGQIVLQYATDGDIESGSWTTIFTHDDDNSISHSAINIESSGAALPKRYKQIQFRLESTGGAEPTFLYFKEDVTSKRYVSD